MATLNDIRFYRTVHNSGYIAYHIASSVSLQMVVEGFAGFDILEQRTLSASEARFRILFGGLSTLLGVYGIRGAGALGGSLFKQASQKAATQFASHGISAVAKNPAIQAIAGKLALHSAGGIAGGTDAFIHTQFAGGSFTDSVSAALMGGSFGILNPSAAFGSLGAGAAGYAVAGGTGYRIGSLVGSLGTGTVSAWARKRSIRYAGFYGAVHGGGVGIGAAYGGYRGGWNGALQGAEYGDFAGGITAALTIKCFEPETPVWIPSMTPVNRLGAWMPPTKTEFPPFDINQMALGLLLIGSIGWISANLSRNMLAQKESDLLELPSFDSLIIPNNPGRLILPNGEYLT